MKQLRAVGLKSFLLVFATAFLWIGVFYTSFDHNPEYRFETDAKYDSAGANLSRHQPKIEYLSDDATRVRIELEGVDRSSIRTWEIPTGKLLEQSSRENSRPHPRPLPTERIVARSFDGNLGVKEVHDALWPNIAPRFVLYDLTTSTPIAELSAKSTFVFHPPEFQFSSDGRFLFAYLGGTLYWWETTFGTLCRITDAEEYTIHEKAGIVITHNLKTDTILGFTYASDEHRFKIWDINTGQQIAERHWGHKVPAEIPAHRMVTSQEGSDLAMVFDVYFEGQRHYVSKAIRSNSDLPHGTVPERSWVLLVNVNEQLEMAHLPGRSACFSQNGDWLATLDEDGVVRVWHLPLRQPWQKIIRNAELATLMTWALILPAAWIARRLIVKRMLSSKN
jgi:WD40 repeat protein